MGLVIFFGGGTFLGLTWGGTFCTYYSSHGGGTFCTYYSRHGGVLFVRTIRDMGGYFFTYYSSHVALFGYPRPDNSPISVLAPSWGVYFPRPNGGGYFPRPK